ncbi:hypothetical protein SLEP1_g58475 [Rubroshorea leprosula]|uniref:Disease resistance protein RGA3 n=1 Tax=Rubroshorea leprosula TaxID=152421 RepID=A0AAV5MT12_9ROSI|nr:hypothetical protein SLEP1_g58475 [Rubroshorea leprosula]
MADLILGPLVDVTTSKVISVTTEQLNLAVGFKQELKKFRVVLRMLRGVLQDAEQKEVTGHFDLQDWLKELGNIVDEADNVVDEIAYEHLSGDGRHRQNYHGKVEMLKTVINKDDNSVDLMSQDRVVKELRKRLEEEAEKETLKEEARKEKLEGKAKNEGREGKNYLLILDDVWNEDSQKWENLRTCLLAMGEDVKGRLLVTTRSQNVATIMGTPPEHIHHLEKLTDEDCWSIIKQRVLVSSSFPSELEGIGRDIASKCRGVALVANVIGGFLCNNKSKDVWLAIKDNSEVWGSIEEVNGVLHVLQLSFNRLPTPALKQCFAFCSIFPKDFVMEKEMLIQLWMAEGFLQPFNESYLEMEDIGDKYFNVLFSYSLFQNVERDSYGSIIACKMHDLVHDLAQFVSKSQTLILEDGSRRNNPADVRHLNVISDKGMAATRFGDATKKLHTLFSQVDVFHSMSMNLRKVRVLSFCGANIHKLPAFLGKMKHLRFLDVSETKIKELPKFITKLYHLQTFRFMNCGEIKRPLKGIWDLVNLRHIYFNDEKLMPSGIGGLTCLKTLQLFAVGQQKGHQIEELGCLSQLRGKLEIRNLHMVRDKEEAMGARLSEKGTMQELQLQFGGESNLSEDRCKQDKDILKGLQPHSNLKGLTIERYCGKSCPSWILETKNFLKNLMFMTFFACPWLESIPSLSLNKEAKVEINCCKNLKSIADSSLQKLIITKCEELVGVEVGQAAMKSLKEVHIESCGKLVNLPMISKLQSLEVLELQQCTELTMIGDDARFNSTCLQQLNIQICDSLMSMPSVDGLSSLQKIQIYDCGQLKSIGEDLSTATCLKELTIIACDGEDLSTATCLKELTVEGCDGLMSFPNLHGLSFLQKIEIRWCGQLKSIGKDLSTATCLEELTITGCYGLMSFPNLHGLSSLQKILISFCKQLKSIGKDLSTATCLKELIVNCCDGLMSFPNLYGLSYLQTLRITCCGGLRSLPSGLPSCTALEELHISYCDNLISIPDDLRRSWSTPSLACLARLKGLTIGGFSTELNEFPDLGFIGSHLEGLTLIAWGEPRERLLDQIQHLTALKSLEIRDFDGLEALPNWFGNLSSLKTLEISNCKSLKHMKAIRRLSKLESLYIDGCPELKERCTRGSGSEWDFISHIPDIWIDRDRIQHKEDSIQVSSAFNYI